MRLYLLMPRVNWCRSDKRPPPSEAWLSAVPWMTVRGLQKRSSSFPLVALPCHSSAILLPQPAYGASCCAVGIYAALAPPPQILDCLNDLVLYLCTEYLARVTQSVAVNCKYGE
jgi:hypothetical protein